MMTAPQRATVSVSLKFEGSESIRQRVETRWFPQAFRLPAGALEDAAAQDEERDIEVNQETGHIDQGGNERSGRRSRIEAATTEKERQHGA